ncbi:M16 family metallopeptidase [Hephaestia sp. GCM10023244]|uniref:M16 family metallopeptidase n=1 Tax=unclassified Hephaestia TaxID=2631281 RepID=UPI002076EF67|nr:pitrilysin family protein [Hephaestia sp. MAHUQ-44]MCM8729651.1 insulinase family protein [Hephaestia sp. MAHUQ-44]
MLFRAALLLGAAALPFAVQAQTAAPASAPAASSSVKPIAFTERTLANGLRVYAIHDPATANVSINVWYDVGSKDDPQGRSGFAHMFEHLMFKATRNLVPEQLDRLTEDVGGYNNASTNDDYTNYYEVVPANHLQRLLFAEADRMASLVVEPTSFASERDVVKEELRLRVLAQPYGKLFYVYFPQISYSKHPYARPGIGSIEDLEAASIDDVRAFHATYYRPDNAILVVAGNFDPAQLDQWIDQYFAPIARPDRPIPRVTVSEPARTRAAHYTVYEPNTPLPAVLISYPLPPDNSPDMPALSVLDAILSKGESSRLYHDLVYRDQIAQSADTYLDSKQQTGALALYAIMAGGKDAADGEAALRKEVARLRDAPVTAAELAEAKNELLTAAIQSRETAAGKANVLAASVIIDGDPRAADKQLAAIAQVTAADIQRVARIYLADEHSAAIRYLPAESAPAGAKGDTVSVPASVVTAPLAAPADIRIVTPASDSARVLPPAPGRPVPVTVPTPVETRLANGMRLITVAKHDLPLVTATVVSGGGAALDPMGRAGLASLTAGLMTKGTATRSATDIASQIESLGGAIASSADWDGSSVTVTIKSDQLAPALGILADVTRNPAFAADEIDRARAQAVDAANLQMTDPMALAGLVANRAIFGAQPYGHVLGGTPTSLPAIVRDDITTAYATSWRPDEVALVLVGDITPDAARMLTERQFGDWKATARPTRATPTTAAPPAPKVVVVDFPDAGQAGIVVGRPAIARSDSRFYAAQVANATLGVGFSSRLNQEIRIKRGLSYGASSQIPDRRAVAPFKAGTQTKNPSAAEVVSLIVAEMAKLGAAPATAAELDTRKAVLVGDFGRAVETTDGIAGILGDYIEEGVPLAELKTYSSDITGVSPAAVQAAAAELFAPKGASIVVVGDSKQFIGDLRKTYPDLELIPSSALDLDQPVLK